MFGLLSQIGFDRMRQENAGAERRNKSGYQFKHWKSPCTGPAVLGRSTGPAFQDGFVKPAKWFRSTTWASRSAEGRKWPN